MIKITIVDIFENKVCLELFTRYFQKQCCLIYVYCITKVLQKFQKLLALYLHLDPIQSL